MQERIVEIILFLVNEMKSNKQLSEVDVSFLTENGYTPTEISTAFSWLFERLSVGHKLVLGEADTRLSHRVLHDAEKMIITPEGYGYLLQCRQLGLLTNSDIETIIERIMAAGFSSVGVPEMKSFVAGMLLDSDSPTGRSGRIALNSSDTIH